MGLHVLLPNNLTNNNSQCLDDFSVRHKKFWTLKDTLYKSIIPIISTSPLYVPFSLIQFLIFPCIITYSHLWVDCLENVETSTSHGPRDLYGLLQIYSFTFTCFSEWYQMKEMDGAFKMNNSHLQTKSSSFCDVTAKRVKWLTSFFRKQ
jgi:hypothetical protein